jgi:hypothetical protein
MLYEPPASAHSPQNLRYLPIPGPFMFRAIVKRHAMTCSKLGRYVRSASPRVSEGWGPGLRSINPGSWTKSTCFPESLTRKTYRKKIPETAIDLSNCPEENPVLDKVDKRYSISGISYEKIVQKKDPGNRDSFVQLVQISRMS